MKKKIAFACATTVLAVIVLSLQSIGTEAVSSTGQAVHLRISLFVITGLLALSVFLWRRFLKKQGREPWT